MPNVVLIDYTAHAEEKIGRYAGVCYGKDIDNSTNAIQRAIKCVERGHLAVLRFAYATFLIEDISRVCSHQLVRVAHMGILQESQRYTKLKKIDAVIPTELNDELKSRVSEIYAESFSLYEKLLDSDIKKEDARFVLPEGTKTRMVMSGNFQAWRHWLDLRTARQAQWEIRNVANCIHGYLHDIAPNLF